MAQSRLILDRYRPVAWAGTGGFATVYKAWDTLIQRNVAIKEIKLSEQDAERLSRPSIRLAWEDSEQDQARQTGAGAGTATLPDLPPFPKDPAFLGGGYAEVPDNTASPQLNVSQQRFLSHIPGLDEARTISTLHDPCIVGIYDLHFEGNTVYLIMEFVEGTTLTRFLRDYEDFLTLDIIASIFADVSHAIQLAHENNVLHLDVKPDNILINLQGQAKVAYFGLATLSDAEGTGTAGGGTIGYMPLEQMRRQPLDARTDEWSLASVTYEMISGENPFLAHDLDQAESAIENAELVLPHILWDELDPAADDVLFYALDPKAENRYETVQDFAEEMSRFLGNPESGRTQLAALLTGQEEEGEGGEDSGAYQQEKSKGLLSGLASRLLPGRKSKAPRLAAAEEGRQPDQDPDHDSSRNRARRSPSQRLSPLALQVASRVGSACMCTFINAFSLMNLPRIDAFSPTVMWILLAAGLVASLIRPHLGTLLSYLMLGLSLCVNGAPALGVLLIAGVIPWWWLVGRNGEAPAHLAMAFPVLGGVALSPLAAPLSGLFLSTGRAVATAALGVLACLGLACVSTLSLTGWDAVSNFMLPSVLAEVQPHIMSMVSNPGTWVVAASWIVSAAVLALCCVPRWRWLAFLGALLSCVVLAAGPLMALVVNPQVAALTLNPFELAPALVAFVVCGATSCMEVPARRH